jgi:hypothetical protein
MSLFDTVRAWLSSKPPAAEPDRKLCLLLRSSVEIVSAYGAVLERGTGHNTPTVRLSDAELPFNKAQITQAIAILQQASRHPQLRAMLIKLLSPMEAQQVLSSQFERSLESGLVLLDNFVPAAEVDAERKQWDEILKIVEQIDPAARARIEHTIAAAHHSDARKNEPPNNGM